MRPPIIRQSSLPARVLGDVTDEMLLYFKCDETTATDSLEDAGPLSINLTDSGSPGSVASLFEGGAAGGRSFNGTDQYFDATTTNATLTTWVNSPDKGVTLLVKPENAGVAEEVLLSLSDTEGDYWLKIALTAQAEVKVYWEESGASLTSYTSPCVLTNDNTYLIGVGFGEFRTGIADLNVFVLNCTDTSETIQQGRIKTLNTFDSETDDIQISVGRDGATNDQYFEGEMDDIVLWNATTTEAQVRELAANYTARYSETEVYGLGSFDTFLKVTVQQEDDSWLDLSNIEGNDHIRGATWQTDIDQNLWTATVDVIRSHENKSLARNLTTSALYDDTNIIDLVREIKIMTATVPKGLKPQETDYTVGFEGFIDSIDWSQEVIPLECRDRWAIFEDTFIEPDANDLSRIYGNDAGLDDIEEVMIELIDDNEPSSSGVFPGGYKGGKPKLRIGSGAAGAFAIVRYRQDPEPLSTAIDTLALLPAFKVGYRFDEIYNQWMWSLTEPPRSSPVSAFTFTKNHYLGIGQLQVDITTVRNAVTVGIADGTVDSEGEPSRTYTERNNEASMRDYGRRWCRIAEGTASYLDTTAEGEALADAILADLKTPYQEFSPVLPYFRRAQVNDYATFSANGVHWGANQDAAFQSITHTCEDGMATTQLVLREDPATKVVSWFNTIVVPGRVTDLPNLPPDNPAAPSVDAIGGGWANIDWDAPVDNWNKDWDRTEVHIGTSPSFTPSGSTLLASVRDKRATVPIDAINDGATQYVQIRHKNKYQSYTDFSAIVSFTPRVVPETIAFKANLDGSDQTLTEGAVALMQWKDTTYDNNPTNNFDFDADDDDADGIDHSWPCDIAGYYDLSVGGKVTWDTASTTLFLVFHIDKSTDGGSVWNEIGRVSVDTSATEETRTLRPLLVLTDVELANGDRVRTRVTAIKQVGAPTNITLLDADTYFKGKLVMQDQS